MSKEKKIIAAKKAFEYVEEGMKLGLGTGSTADEFTKILSDNVKDGFQITCVPTSENTKKLAESLEIPLGTLEDYNILDLTIDGADEIDDNLSLLDVGGGASKEKVSAAFKIILSDKNVKGILINIFGGIMRCDVLAQGVVDAAKEINISVPLIVRLAGTNFKEGKEILDNSGLKLISAENLDDAAKKIVEAIK